MYQFDQNWPKTRVTEFKFRPKIQVPPENSSKIHFSWHCIDSIWPFSMKILKFTHFSWSWKYKNLHFLAKIISQDKPPYVYYGWIDSKTNVLFLGKQILQLRHGAGIKPNLFEFVRICWNQTVFVSLTLIFC